MCGIVGQFSARGRLLEEALLVQLTARLAHRGPDGGAFWSDEHFFLGHRRLSIIDLSPAGTQPMFTGDDRYGIVFNGEIYNYVELREELAGHGVVFRSRSDTEVLLEGFRVWGEELPKRLTGMFAFAIADRVERSLFAARDRFGEKPFFLAETADGVVFASEMKCLTALPGLDRGLRVSALRDYLQLNYVPGPRTLVASVRRLRPGEWMRATERGVTFGTYWQAGTQPAEAAPRGAQSLERLQELLDESLRVTLRSDVPVTLFLSGGIDSSLVAESAVRQGKISEAFCIDFADPGGYSEWENARFVADRLGIGLNRVTLSDSVLDEFERIVDHADDPLADSSQLCVWAIARAASRRYKVTISGDGGDELFGGYLTYVASMLHRRYVAPLPAPIKRFVARAARWIPMGSGKVPVSVKLVRFLRAAELGPQLAHRSWNGTWLPAAAERLLSRDHAGPPAEPQGVEGPSGLRELQLLDIATYLPDDILAKMDRMTMAWGLESRAPLLNPAIADFALSLPDDRRVDARFRTKVLLRELVAQKFGARVASAPKKGFSVPIHDWLRTPRGRALLEGAMTSEAFALLPQLEERAVRDVVRDFASGRAQTGFEVWGLAVLLQWAQLNLRSRPPVLSPDDGMTRVSRRS